MAHNTALGQAAGITDEQIEAIGSDDYMDSPSLSPREKAAVLWAEHITKNTARERDDVFEQLREQFTEPEIVELTLMSGFFNLFNRLTDSLRIPIESHGEVEGIRRSVRLAPEKVRGYLEAVLRTWPSEFPKAAG